MDTSVFGGCMDAEFRAESIALMKLIEKGQFQLLLSDLLVRELEKAPEAVRNVLAALPGKSIEGITLNEESERLRDAYMKAKVVGPAQRNDAQHVALASVARADMIVSWNFKHIVHYDKIRGFNAVNLREGYMPIEIHSPKEVV